MYRFTPFRVGTLLLFCAVFSLFFSPLAHANIDDLIVETGCGAPDVPYYTGVVNPANDTYDVYVKLGKVGQTASVSGYVRFDDGSTTCGDIGSVEASGSEWRKLGSYADIDGEAQTILQLSSTVLEDIPNANRPTLMLVSQTNPVCEPKLQCETTYAGQKVYISPTSQPTNDYALNIIEAKSLAGDTVKKVEYYADNERLYETKQLEAFNTSLSPNYANKLYRVIYLDSGQKAISEQDAPGPHMDSLWIFVVRTFEKYQQIVLILLGVIALLGLIYGARAIVQARARRHMWRVAHGLEQEKAEKMLSARQVAFNTTRDRVIVVAEKASLVVGAAMIIVLVLSMSIIQIGTVSGHSMDTTFQDGQKIFINKLPVTFANLNGTAYLPKRGEVVVAYPNFGTNLADDKISNEETIIKRVLGLPGERVVVDHGKLTVYNNDNKNGFDPTVGVSWAAHIQSDDSTDYIDVTLDKNQIFLCGDNRPVSIDSRFNGPIATSQIVGIVN
jgi:signal peptidase I